MSQVENMPALRRGYGASPQEGGCLVQIANWLCDQTQWTDGPLYVNRVLQQFGVAVNDCVGDAARRELALAAVRIAGTRDPRGDTADNVKYIAAMQRKADELFLPLATPCPRCNGSHGLFGNGEAEDLVVANVGGGADEDLVAQYFKLIDYYEELSGHTPIRVPETLWAHLAMAMLPEHEIEEPAAALTR